MTSFRRVASIVFNTKRIHFPLAASIAAGSVFYCDWQRRRLLPFVVQTETTQKIVIAQKSLVRRQNLQNFEMDYEIIGKLGEGGFANVYKVRHRATGFIRTAKVVDFHTKSEADMFQNDVDVMTNLNSPYIARIVEYYADWRSITNMITGQKGVIIYHFIDGHDLLDAINARIVGKGSFSDVEIRSIVRQILKSLRYLHNMNYVHGDVKPENFIVSSDRTSRLILKLIDFGLTSRDHLSPIDVQKAGTSFYMAPEAFNRAASTYSAKSDCWSVGVIFATIVSHGTALVERSTSFNKRAPLQAIDSNFVSTEMNRLEQEGVPREYVDLISRLLVYHPQNRLSSTNALEDPLMAGSYKFDPSFGPNLVKTIAAMKEYAQLPILARLIRLMAAHQINDADVPETRMVFRCLDREADGLISAGDIVAANSEAASFDIEEVISKSDLQGNKGRLGFENFIAASMPPLSEQHVSSIFQEIDTRKRGYIEADDLTVYFSHSGFSVAASQMILESCKHMTVSTAPTHLDLESFTRCINGI